MDPEEIIPDSQRLYLPACLLDFSEEKKLILQIVNWEL